MRRVHAAPAPCLECGRPFAPSCYAAVFCRSGCRSAWNNRRKTRGAELLDLYMAHRYDRPAATSLGVLTLLNRLAAIYRAEDRRDRAGRRSWTPPADVLARHPALRSTVLTRRKP